MSCRIGPAAFVISVAFFGSLSAEAGTHTWTGATSQFWSDDGNWIEGSPAGDPSPDLIYPDNASTLESTDDLPGATPVHSIRFNGPGYTLDAVNGSWIALRGGIDAAPGSGANTITLPLVFSGGTGSSNVVTTSFGTRLELSGPISGSFQVYGDPMGGNGTVVLSGTVAGGIVVGRTQPSLRALLLFNGWQGASEISILSGTLGGTGTTRSIILAGPTNAFAVPAAIEPGGDVATGSLSVEGFVTMKANIVGNEFRVKLNGNTPEYEYDQLNVSGDVFLESPRPMALPVRLRVSLGFVPEIGDCFTIINCGDRFRGNFDVGPDGSTFTVQGVIFQINYTANSVILTRVA